MSIDDRLRSGMEPVGGLPGVTDPAFVRAVAGKADHRQKVRRVTALSCAAALIVVVAVALPKALDAQRSDDVPVNTPTPAPTAATETWTFDPQTTSIDGDGTWGTRAITRAARLAALDGTGLERYGAQAFRKAYPRWPMYHTPDRTCDCVPTSMSLGWGTVLVRAGYTGGGAGTSLTLNGTYSVEGHLAIFDFEGVGRSTYRWKLSEDHQKLTFAFVSAERGSTISGLPAEVTLRMLLTAAHFGGTHRGF
jgi:hypothetical protein